MQKLKNDWNPGIWVLIWEFSARAFQWKPTWQGLDGFQETLRLCALDESNLSIARVKILTFCCVVVTLHLNFNENFILCKASTILPTFDILNDADKLVFLLSNCDIIFFSVKSCCKMLNIRTDYQEQILCDINTLLTIYILYSLSV